MRTNDALLPQELIEIIYEFTGVEHAFDLRLISHDFDLSNSDKIWITLAKQKGWRLLPNQKAFNYCLERVTRKRLIEKYLNHVRPLIHEVYPPDNKPIIVPDSFTLPYDLEAFFELSSGFSFEGGDYFTPNMSKELHILYDEDEKTYLHTSNKITTKWLVFGQEAEYSEWLVCCDEENPDFGGISYFVNNCSTGEFVHKSFLDMMEGMYKAFKRLQEVFTNEEILHLVENGCSDSGSESSYRGNDPVELLATMRSWKDPHVYQIEREKFFSRIQE